MTANNRQNTTIPAAVTDQPDVRDREGARTIDALWPLQAIGGDSDSNGTQYAVLSVSHLASRHSYIALLNREDHLHHSIRSQPFDAVRVGALIPAARFSQKSLRAALDAALRLLRDEIARGNDQLAAFFTPSAQ